MNAIATTPVRTPRSREGATGSRRLVKALNANWRFRHGEMFRWLLSEALVLVGLPPWEPVPDEAREQVHAALHVYEEQVAESPPFTDVLGETYMELASVWGRSRMGQYFTPQPVARCMAAMTLNDGLPDKESLVTVCDPAVGSGVMMLAFLQEVIERHGRAALRRFSVTGIDLDPVCARMFPLQVLANSAIHGLQVGEVLAYHGNALGDPAKLKVVLHATAPEVTAAPARHPERLKALAHALPRAVGQIPLFELPEPA